MRDHNAIIGRWSLSWNLLSKRARSRSEANKIYQCSRVAGEPRLFSKKISQVVVVFGTLDVLSGQSLYILDMSA